MTEKRIPYRPETISPPGETVADILKERNMTQTELAQRMGRPLKTINEVLKGKAAITPETAIQLERVLGTPAAYWLNHEAQYRASLIRRGEEAALDEWHDWLDQMPVNELKRLGILSNLRKFGKNKNVLLRELLSFFGVASPDEWRTMYGDLQIAFRQSMPEQSDLFARSAWLRLGELIAARTLVERFDYKRFKAALYDIRTLTLLPPEEFEPKLKAACAEAGVILALVPAIPRARVSGAARWVNQRPLIQLSLYGKTNDRFWFTFYHEACHILEHPRKLVFVDEWNHSAVSEMEEEADRFAAELLIPSTYEAQLSGLTSKVMVESFAQRIGVHPGIVVARLQHEGIIERSWMNDLKATYKWNEPRRA